MRGTKPLRRLRELTKQHLTTALHILRVPADGGFLFERRKRDKLLQRELTAYLKLKLITLSPKELAILLTKCVVEGSLRLFRDR